MDKDSADFCVFDRWYSEIKEDLGDRYFSLYLTRNTAKGYTVDLYIHGLDMIIHASTWDGTDELPSEFQEAIREAQELNVIERRNDNEYIIQ